MQQLIYFFQKYRYFLFFILLEFIALALIVNNNSFHKSKFVSSANNITGGFYNKANSLSDYFQLNSENNTLIEENLALKNQIEQLKEALEKTSTSSVLDSSYSQQYLYTSGKIVKNQYSLKNNFLLINLGKNDSIASEMAVVNSKGIIGVTEEVSNKYSRVQSILNQKININARLKNDNNYFGTITWNGNNYNIVQLLDIPRQAIVKKGDTIITGGRSAIFPEGVLVGTVLNIEEGGTSVTKVINVQLFNDMSNLKNIYVIKNFDKEEIQELENNNNE